MNIKKLAKGYWQKIATKIHAGVSKNTKNELTTNVSNQQENETQQFESPPVRQTQEQLNLISCPPNFEELQEQQLSYDQDYSDLGNPMESTICPTKQQLTDQKAKLERLKIELNNKKIVEKVQPEPIIQTQEQLNLVPCSKNSQKSQIQEEEQSSYYQDCIDLGSPMKKTHFTNPVKITFVESVFYGQGQESIVLENDKTTLEKKQKLGQTQEELNPIGSTIYSQRQVSFSSESSEDEEDNDNIDKNLRKIFPEEECQLFLQKQQKPSPLELMLLKELARHKEQLENQMTQLEQIKNEKTYIEEKQPVQLPFSNKQSNYPNEDIISLGNSSDNSDDFIMIG